MKISTKLTLNISIISAVLLAIGIFIGIMAIRVYRLVNELEQLPEIQAKLGTLTVQHYEWVEALGVGTMLMGKPFTKTLDPTKCDLGKWYYSFTPPEQIKDAYAKVEEPHRKFHGTAEKIINAMNSGNVELAKQIYQEETIPNLEKTRNALTEMRLGIKNIVNDNLDQISNLMKQLRTTIIIAFGGVILFSILFTFYFIIKPLRLNLNKLIGIANAVARGDFDSIRGEIQN